jgi:hypothetical protein
VFVWWLWPSGHGDMHLMRTVSRRTSKYIPTAQRPQRSTRRPSAHGERLSHRPSTPPTHAVHHEPQPGEPRRRGAKQKGGFSRPRFQSAYKAWAAPSPPSRDSPSPRAVCCRAVSRLSAWARRNEDAEQAWLTYLCSLAFWLARALGLLGCCCLRTCVRPFRPSCCWFGCCTCTPGSWTTFLHTRHSVRFPVPPCIAAASCICGSFISTLF